MDGWMGGWMDGWTLAWESVGRGSGFRPLRKSRNRQGGLAVAGAMDSDPGDKNVWQGQWIQTLATIEKSPRWISCGRGNEVWPWRQELVAGAWCCKLGFRVALVNGWMDQWIGGWTDWWIASTPNHRHKNAIPLIWKHRFLQTHVFVWKVFKKLLVDDCQIWKFGFWLEGVSFFDCRHDSRFSQHLSSEI